VAAKELVPTDLRIGHEDGKVTIGGIDGVEVIRLDPDAALTFARAVTKHADLAYEQKLSQP
jgi:hypothetical protein